jgi:hypothetical protein
MSSHRVGWVRIGAASLAARVLFATIAAAGHLLFLWSLSWSLDQRGFFASLLAFPNVALLCGVAFRPRPKALDPGAAVGAGVALTLFLGVAALAVASTLRLLDGKYLIVSGAVVLFCGFLGATVAAPLAVALSRWRLDPTPRRALDAWATLLCVAAVFAFVRPVGLAHDLGRCAVPLGWSDCRAVALGRTLAALDTAMVIAAVASAVGLWSFERGVRRWLAAARAGRAPGFRLAADDLADAATAPRWGLTDEGPERALVAVGTDASYRDNATGTVVARIPLSAEASWREAAMFLVITLGVVALLGRALL